MGGENVRLAINVSTTNYKAIDGLQRADFIEIFFVSDQELPEGRQRRQCNLQNIPQRVCGHTLHMTGKGAGKTVPSLCIGIGPAGNTFATEWNVPISPGAPQQSLLLWPSCSETGIAKRWG